MTSLEPTKQNERHPTTEAQQSIPSILQDSVVNGFETIWLFEIRPYFQEVAKKYIDDPDAAQKLHPDFPRAVLTGIRHVKKLMPLNNFEEWDLSRFLAAMSQMKNDPIKDIKGIGKFIQEWRELRNRIAHASHGSASLGLADAELTSHITTARACVSKIRRLDDSNPRGKEIFRELKELEQLLRGELARGSARVSADTDSEVRDLAIDAANA